ncbi:MAG: terminase [Myxococcaceae bacterium]
MDDERDTMGLLAWQWLNYPQGHRNRLNLALHGATAPLFVVGTIMLVVAPLYRWQLAPIGLAGVLVAFAAQRRGHRSELARPKPFRGASDVLARFFVEQWVTFPRYVLSGGFARAWRAR